MHRESRKARWSATALLGSGGQQTVVKMLPTAEGRGAAGGSGHTVRLFCLLFSSQMQDTLRACMRFCMRVSGGEPLATHAARKVRADAVLTGEACVLSSSSSAMIMGRDIVANFTRQLVAKKLPC